VAARAATPADLPELLRLYGELSAEMTALRPMWALSEALAAPEAEALGAMLASSDWTLIVGTLDGVAVGFLAWRDEPLLPQAEGARVAAIRYVFTESEARGVGIGEAMVADFFAGAERRGITRFDAHVSPGHRAAKNFFEANGFKARSIVMHRTDA
jgi:GNAT superfamily N-acetyltransferase